MSNKLFQRSVAAIVAVGAIAATVQTANAGRHYYFHFGAPDGTQAYNSRVIAGAAPSAYSTYIKGIRCHYEYRVQYGERVRFEVCN